MGSAQAQVPTLLIPGSQTQVPVIGLGTWKTAPGEVQQVIKDAIDVGFRHFDGALLYGNEAEVGEAIQDKMQEGVVKRKDLFITGKLWNTFHSQEKVVSSLKKTLADLRMTYVDLYLIHFPMGYQEGGDLFPKNSEDQILYSDVDYIETWRSMEECVRLGLAKHIGISNFNRDQIERILDNCLIKPAFNQIEVHPYLNQEKLINFCKSKDILVTGYSPLGSPDSPFAIPGTSLIKESKLIEIGRKYGKSAAQVALRWQVERGLIVIPKTVRKERMIENLDIFDFTLSTEDVNSINSIESNNANTGRVLTAPWLKDHKYYPFTAEY